jgi:two-component system sensor histidine kinase KdpD
MRLMPSRRGTALWVVLVAGLGVPALASLLARLLDATTAVAALVYVLAVVAAAWVGGIGAGVLASVLSFVGLNYLFTPPLHTFRVESTDDLVALFVFLGVSFLVGSLVARALDLRRRAERREEQARVLYGLLARLRAREPAGHILEIAVADVARVFEFEDVRIAVDDPPISRSAIDDGPWDATVVLPLRVGDRDIGRLDARGEVPPEHDAVVLRTFAGQLALVMESARIDEAARRAEVDAQSSQVRAALFGSVTHDLRTPLASIKASVTSLLDQDVRFEDAQRRELLQTILEETDRLNRLVANLLDLSRIRTGALVPAKVPVEAGELVDAVVARLRPLLGVRRVEVKVRDELPEVWADPVQMDQVLSNLVENAVKFSPPTSPILVTVARWQDGIQVRVADRGPGVAPDARERVFEAFARGDDEGASTGTGLGLAIARAVVSVHGGRIWLEETPGGGTTVVFELPGGAPEPASRTR